jgi:predicted metalloprotease with PDZ domain
VIFTVFRFDQLHQIDVTLGARTPEQRRFVAVESQNEAQRALYQGWMGAELK